MFSEHDPHCDQTHTMRQRCNDNLRADAAALARLTGEPPAPASNGHAHGAPPAAPEPAIADPATFLEPASPAAVPADALPLVVEGYTPSPLQREAVADVEVPEPTPYVTREWACTAAAVDGHDAGGRYDLDPATDERDRSALRIAVIAWALILIAWLLLRRRSHGAKS